MAERPEGRPGYSTYRDRDLQTDDIRRPRAVFRTSAPASQRCLARPGRRVQRSPRRRLVGVGAAESLVRQFHLGGSAYPDSSAWPGTPFRVPMIVNGRAQVTGGDEAIPAGNVLAIRRESTRPGRRERGPETAARVPGALSSPSPMPGTRLLRRERGGNRRTVSGRNLISSSGSTMGSDGSMTRGRSFPGGVSSATRGSPPPPNGNWSRF